MTFSRTGFTLYVDDYPACVAVSRDTLGLPVLFDGPEQTCFDFGGSSLMVKRDDEAHERDARPHRTGLRMNVPDVREHADRLLAQGVAVDSQEHDWGTVAKFVDPAGTLCAFKDEARFEQHVREQSP